MTHGPVTPADTVPPTRPDPTIRTSAGNSIHPTSRNADDIRADNALPPLPVTVDGWTNEKPPRCRHCGSTYLALHYAECPTLSQLNHASEALTDAGPFLRPVDGSGLTAPVDSRPVVSSAPVSGGGWVAPRGGYAPEVASLVVDDGLVEACARAEHERLRQAVLRSRPTVRVGSFDEMPAYVREARLRDAADRLPVLLPVIAEWLSRSS